MLSDSIERKKRWDKDRVDRKTEKKKREKERKAGTQNKLLGVSERMCECMNAYVHEQNKASTLRLVLAHVSSRLKAKSSMSSSSSSGSGSRS